MTMDNRQTMSRRGLLRRGVAATGAAIVGSVAASGTVAAGIGDGRVLDFHLNNINYDRDQGTISSGHVHDASPYKNHGEWSDLDDDPVVKDGAVGNAFAFDGSNDEIVVSSNSSLNPTGAVTVAAWVKPSADISSGYDNKGVAGKWNAGEGGAQYVLWTGVGGNLDYTFSVKTANGRADASATISDSEWHHIAGVFDGTASLYVDGVETTGSSATGDIVTSSVPFKVGNYATGKHFAGMIDEARVYDRALSDAEIDDLVAMRDTA